MRDILREVEDRLVNVQIAIGKCVEVLELYGKGSKRQPMTLAAGLTFNSAGDLINMGTSTTFTLTNAANPELATRWLGIIDLENDVSDVPIITISNPALLASAIGTITAANPGNPSATPPVPATPAQVAVGLYPIDTNAETDDSVSVTLTLPTGSPLILTAIISGVPVEGEVVDAASPGVGAWAGAPVVPSTPT